MISLLHQCSFLFDLLFVGAPIENRFQLVRKNALITDRVELKDSEASGLHWYTVSPDDPPPGVAASDLHQHMWVRAQKLEYGEKVSLHCQNVLNKVAMKHRHASFACFEIAVFGTEQKYKSKPNVVESNDSILEDMMERAYITSRMQRHG